jgi:hypothetical protein
MDKTLLDNVLDMSTSLQDSSLETHREYHLSKLSSRGTGDPWPTRSPILCWHCCHSFESLPVGIPIDDNQLECRLVGNFCSFDCAYAYAIDDGNHITDYTAGCRVKSLAKSILGIAPDKINAAPNRLCLEAFGGTITIEEFRANTHRITVMSEPFVSTHMLICAQQRINSQSLHKDKETQPSAKNDKRFRVTGLRKPDTPLPANKVLCEQDVSLGDGMYMQFLKERGNRNSMILSDGNSQNSQNAYKKAKTGSLLSFVKKK